jgi:Phage tail lysozyme
VALNGYAIAYSVGGGLILFSGMKGATIADTISAVLKGNLSVTRTESIAPQDITSTASGPAGSGAPGPVTSGSEIQNGTTIYQYLRGNGYSPMQAAGAIASIWGESTWNPEAQGTGGRGLMGWTPASTLPDSAFTGNAAKDMSAQLPLILHFVAVNGDSGAVAMMAGAATVHDAAEIWGQKVERYGIDDVHTTGVDLAVQIAKTVDNVTLKAA